MWGLGSESPHPVSEDLDIFKAPFQAPCDVGGNTKGLAVANELAYVVSIRVL